MQQTNSTSFITKIWIFLHPFASSLFLFSPLFTFSPDNLLLDAYRVAKIHLFFQILLAMLLWLFCLASSTGHQVTGSQTIVFWSHQTKDVPPVLIRHLFMLVTKVYSRWKRRNGLFSWMLSLFAGNFISICMQLGSSEITGVVHFVPIILSYLISVSVITFVELSFYSGAFIFSILMQRSNFLNYFVFLFKLNLGSHSLTGCRQNKIDTEGRQLRSENECLFTAY